MTTTDSPDPSRPAATPPPRTSRPLVRTRDDRVVAGVAAGIGYWLDIDPVIVRVVFAVLTIFGGAGLLLYLVGWLFIPEAGSSASVAEAWLAGRQIQRPPAVVLAAAVVAVVVAAGVVSHDLNASLVLAAVSTLAVLAVRSRSTAAARQARPPAAGTDESPSTVPLGAAAPFDDPYTDAYEPFDDPYRLAGDDAEPTARRPLRRSTTHAVLSVALVAAGAALLLDRLTGLDLTLTQLLAIPLATLGAGLALGAFMGRSWIAMGVGAALALAVFGSIAVGGHWHSHRAVTWDPTAGQLRPDYHLTTGAAVLDLTDVGNLAGQSVHADVGTGTLRVVVPPGIPARVHADAGIGRLDVFGTNDGGFNLDRSVTDTGFTKATGVDLDLHVGAGQVEVQRG